MSYKLAVFDWNGTLIDDLHANWKGANASLVAGGQPPITLERYRDTMDFPVLHLYARNGIDPDTYLANFQEYGLAFLNVYREEAKAAPLREGAMEVLDALLDRGVATMVLSNYVQHELEAQMAQRHVLGKFKHISGNLAFNEREHSRTTKIERLQQVLDDHGYAPDEAFIIGDSLEEPDIAQHFGMMCVSVTWGCISPERLKKSKTHHMIDEFASLLPILGARSLKAGAP
ncbi:MAG: HAD family hydrolase [Pseudobdellovibrionaceae bacterium]